MRRMTSSERWQWQEEKAGLAPRIITGDKDALQLATDITKVIFTKRGISEFEVYDREAMLQRYGLTPEQFYRSERG